MSLVESSTVEDLVEALLAPTSERIRAEGLVGVSYLPSIAARHARSVSAPARAVAERRKRVTTVATALVDLFAIVGAYALAAAVQGVGSVGEPALRLRAAVWATAPLWLAVFALYGLYDRRRMAAASEEARRLFHGVTVGVVALITTTFVIGAPLPRTWIAAVWFAALLSVGGSRVVVRRVIRNLNIRGVLGSRTLVVGVNEEARTIARMLRRQAWLGYQPFGFVEPVAGGFPSVDGLPVVGSVDAIGAAIERADASAVLIAGTAIPRDELRDLYRVLQGLDVEVRMSAGLPDVAASRVSVEPLDGVAVLSLRRNELSRVQTIVKRAFDVVGGSILILVASPVMLAVATAVRATSRGSVFFRQVRAGAGGTPFTIWKFRTMVVDAEEQLAALRARNEADGLLFKLVDDPRVTRVGRFLRRTGLDELPQLWNVLRGDMSLVGPRPPLPEETARYDEWVRGRLRVKPGITGLWQVNGRHELSFADYVRYDLFYVENWSLGLDLYVLARTLPALWRRQGAF